MQKALGGVALGENEKMADSIAKMHALKRIGDGEDFSSLVNFLC